jgi:hypothetical protein
MALALAACLAVACATSAPQAFNEGPGGADGGATEAGTTTLPTNEDGAVPTGQDGSAGPTPAFPDATLIDTGVAEDSGAAPPPDLAPAPSLSKITPTSALVGTAGPTITCTGSGFVARSVVQVNAVPLTTSFVSSTELQATLPTSDVALVGQLHVTVGTAPPGGGASSELEFQVVNPSPAITTLEPTSAPVGSPATLLTVLGSSFVTGSTLSFAGTALPTDVVDEKTLSATIPAASLATSGTFPVLVTNPTPGGGPSSSIAFIVANPNVTITSVTPSTLFVGGAGATLSLVGTGFVAASSVSFNGAAIPTTFTSATELAATVPASALGNSGNFPVAVTNPPPGGGVSAPITVAVVYPAVTAASVAPSSAPLGAPPATLTVTGTGFLANVTQIDLDGAPLLTTVTDATHAQATLTTAQMSTPHVFQVTVVNPAPGGGTSSPALTFAVDDPAPAATTVSPSTLLVGAPPSVVTVTGTGFVTASTVLLGTTVLPTTYVNATTLTAVVPSSNLVSAGTLSLYVSNPAPGGGTSSPALALNVNDPAPVATSVAPSFALVGSAATPVTVTGGGFISTSTINLGGTALPTTYLSPASLSAVIPASDLASAAMLSLTVTTPAPGGGTSSALMFVVDNSGPSITGLSPTSTTVPGAATPITVTGSGLSAVSVIQIGTTPVATTYQGGGLAAVIPAADLAQAATLSITVANPSPGGGTSNALYFTANDPVPTLTAVSPTSLYALSGATTITLTGTGFVNGSQVQVNGAAIPVTASTPTSLTATVPAAVLASPGTLSVTVFNPAPGGGTSAPQTLGVSCNTSAATVVFRSLNSPTTLPLSFTGAPTAYRITKSQQNAACPSHDDTTGTEPYLGFVVVNDTSAPATLSAWAVCDTTTDETDDGFLTFYSGSTVPSTQAQLEQCTDYVAEGEFGAGGHASPQSGSDDYCPGLTKAGGDGLTLAACATAVVLIQPYSTTNSSYTPPTSLTIELQ